MSRRVGKNRIEISNSEAWLLAILSALGVINSLLLFLKNLGAI